MTVNSYFCLQTFIYANTRTHVYVKLQNSQHEAGSKFKQFYQHFDFAKIQVADLQKSILFYDSWSDCVDSSVFFFF